MLKVLSHLSEKSGQGGDISGAYIISDATDKMKTYAEKKMAENADSNRKPYTLSGNNCGTFARDVIAQDDKVDNPSISKPTPSNIVDEYVEEGNASVEFSSKNKTLNIGKGDESDAKKK